MTRTSTLNFKRVLAALCAALIVGGAVPAQPVADLFSTVAVAENTDKITAEITNGPGAPVEYGCSLSTLELTVKKNGETFTPDAVVWKYLKDGDTKWTAFDPKNYMLPVGKYKIKAVVPATANYPYAESQEVDIEIYPSNGKLDVSQLGESGFVAMRNGNIELPGITEQNDLTGGDKISIYTVEKFVELSAKLPDSTELEVTYTAVSETIGDTTYTNRYEFSVPDTLPKGAVITVASRSIIDNGTLENSNIEWTLDSNGKLFVKAESGTAPVPDYKSPNDAAYRPAWDKYKEKITSVEFASNITGVGDYAFYGFDKIESINFLSADDAKKSKLTRIGCSAFDACGSLKTVVIPVNTTAVGVASKINTDANPNAGGGAFTGNSAETVYPYADPAKITAWELPNYDFNTTTVIYTPAKYVEGYKAIKNTNNGELLKYGSVLPIEEVKGTSLTLDGAIGVNFYVKPSCLTDSFELAGPRDTVTYSGDDLTAALVTEGDYAGCYKLSYYVYSDEMADKVTLKVLTGGTAYSFRAGSDTVESFNYCVNDYQLPAENDDTYLKRLVDAMKEYGKASKNYFDGKSNSVSNTLVADVKAPTIEGTTVKGVDISLVLNSTTEMRFYVPDEITSVTIDGKEITEFKTKNGKKYASITDIAANELRRKHTVMIGTMTINDIAPMYYCVLHKDTSDKFSQVGNALYAYGFYAEEYFARLNG